MASACKTYNIPLIVVADTMKFSREVELDSISKNEINDPNSFRPASLAAFSLHPSMFSEEKWALEGFEKIEK